MLCEDPTDSERFSMEMNESELGISRIHELWPRRTNEE